VHLVTHDISATIKKQAVHRKDDWDRIVLNILSTCDYLVAKQARYHRKCYINFERSRSTLRGRPQSIEIISAINIVYNYIEDNDDCQFSIYELEDVIKKKTKEFPMSTTTLKAKLLEYYGDVIIITSNKNNVLTVCLSNVGHKVLSDNSYKERNLDENTEKLRIVKAAAQIIRDDIAKIMYDSSSYPNTYNFLENIHNIVPDSLQTFLETVIITTTKTIHKI